MFAIIFTDRGMTFEEQIVMFLGIDYVYIHKNERFFGLEIIGIYYFYKTQFPLITPIHYDKMT